MKKENKYFKFPLASSIFEFDLKCDLHSHSTFSDGKNTIAEMIAIAQENQLDYFAITEHVRTSFDSKWKAYVETIKSERLNKKLQVLIGIEANAIGPAGNIDVTEQMLKDSELILGAVHGYYHDDSWEKITDGSLPKNKALEYEMEKALGLCDNPNVHVLAHPGWLFEKHYESFPEQELKTIFEYAAKTGTAVEINQWYTKKSKNFLELLTSTNPLVSFGSNAHSCAGVCNVSGIFKDFILKNQ